MAVIIGRWTCEFCGCPSLIRTCSFNHRISIFTIPWFRWFTNDASPLERAWCAGIIYQHMLSFLLRHFTWLQASIGSHRILRLPVCMIEHHWEISVCRYDNVHQAAASLTKTLSALSLYHNCNPSSIRAQFDMIRERFNKVGGEQFGGVASEAHSVLASYIEWRHKHSALHAGWLQYCLTVVIWMLQSFS